MEKRTPHYKLGLIKELTSAGKVSATEVAAVGALNMGFTYVTMFDVILNLTTKDFYKSMTSYNDHTKWQDVYRPNTQLGDVYLKLTIIKDVLVISFKEL